MNLKKIFAPAISAIKHYGLPFAIFQMCAAATVISYYNFPSFQNACAIIAKWKVEGGIFFAAWTTAVIAGIIPEILKSITGKARRPLTDISRLKDIAFNLCYFASVGVLVFLLYTAQSIAFGNANDLRTLVIKVLVDQFVWNPLGGAPYSIIFYLWREKRFNIIATIKAFNFTLYKERIAPLLYITWLYWMPMVVCIYAMPENLQFPLYLCAQAAWSLLFIFIIQESRNENASLV